MKSTLTMRYPSQAYGEVWREGAPCGNGVVGALVYGGAAREMILLNHTKMWRAGSVQEMPDVSYCIPEIRKLLDEQRPDLADGVLYRELKKHGYGPDNCQPLPMVDIRIENVESPSFRKYRRVIDMDKAEVRVSWMQGDTLFTRDTFVSRADGLCYTRIRAQGSDKIRVYVDLTTHIQEDNRHNQIVKNREVEIKDNRVLYSAEVDTCYEAAKGRYGAVMDVQQKGGSMEADGKRFRITDAEEVLLVTSLFLGKDSENTYADAYAELEGASDYETALEKHTALHSPLFRAAEFSLGAPEEEETNEMLLMDAFENEMSPALTEKMYAYGRYLFLCSTNDTNGMPTHLIGLWNGLYDCFWAFHMFNINFEMIYWQALSGNLPGYMRLALDYVEGFMDDFRENARKMYGCRGIYLDSVNTPEGGLAACLCNHIINWTAGAAWVSQQFYDYYRYTGDEAYLREHAMPFMAEAALFYEDYLVEGEDGKYQFYPTTSAENVSSTTTRLFHSGAQVSKTTAMDIAVCQELLMNLLDCVKLTGMYAEKVPVWEAMLAKLPEYKYNPDGSLKEWADDFYDDCDQHRHQSHLYGVFPGNTVTADSPEYAAFCKAEDNRLRDGLYHMSSWSMVFMSCIYARMNRGDTALYALSEMVRTCCMNNLFTLHNDFRRMGPVGCNFGQWSPFQIDANIGFPAAIHEMLLCCRRDNSLTLFPALPAAWKQGKMEGMLAVGGHTVSMYWEENKARVVLAGGYRSEVTLTADSGWLFANGQKQITVQVNGTAELELTR